MTRHTLHGALALAIVLLAMAPIRTGAQSDEVERIRESITVFDEIMAARDKAIPNSVLEKSEGIAVFPSTIKGGFIVGGQHGRGILSARLTGGRAWSAPGFMTVTGGSFGAQIGAQAVDLVLVIVNRRGLQKMMGNEFKVGVDAGVAAGPVGREASAATDIQMRAEIFSYSRSRGLFAGINLNGASIRSDDDANQRFYGKTLRTADVIFKMIPDVPSAAGDWRTTLAKYAK
jgi:lipid-binding SYLF domain-containing protein